MTKKLEPGKPTPSLPAAQCRVCTKNIHAGEERVEVYYAGAYYIVCCVMCKARFESSPRQYVIEL